MVCVDPYGHEVHELNGVPPVEVLGHSADQIATDEDVEDSGDKGDLFAQRNCEGFVPSLIQVVDRSLHARSVFRQLFVGRRDSLAPLFHSTVSGIVAVVLILSCWRVSFSFCAAMVDCHLSSLAGRARLSKMSKKLSLSSGTSQSSCMDWLPIYEEFRESR